MKRTFVLCAVALLTSVPGFAQSEPRSAFSGGYDFLRLAGEGSESLLSGWYGEVATNVTPMFATVGQMAGHYQNLNGASLHTFAAGVRISTQHRKAAPFGQFLVGLALLSSSSVAQLPANHVGPAPLGLRGSGGSALLQMGAGVDLMRDAPIGIRIGADVLHTGDAIGNMLRVAVGVVVPFHRSKRTP